MFIYQPFLFLVAILIKINFKSCELYKSTKYFLKIEKIITDLFLNCNIQMVSVYFCLCINP